MASPVQSTAFQQTLDGVPLGGTPTRTTLGVTQLSPSLFLFNHGGDGGIGLRDENCEINVYRTKAKLHRLPETRLFVEYRRLFYESSMVNFFVRVLSDEISSSSYYFEGPDDLVEKVENFWFENKMYEELEEVCQQAVLFGTGVGATLRSGGELVGFKRVDVQSVKIERDKRTGKETIEQINGPDLTGNAFLLRFIKFADTPWGISFVRPVIMGIQGLDNLLRDIPPAIKQLAYVDRVLKLDLSEISDPGEKKKILKNARDSFSEYDSANTTVVVMDGKHEFGYMGNVGNAGGGQKRIDPIMPAIEPVIVFIIANFHIAPGEILQKDANQATLRQQVKEGRKRVANLRKKFSRQVESQIIAPLLGETGRPSVRIRYEPEPISPEDEADILNTESQRGLITREEYRRKRGYRGEPDGTFFSDTPEFLRSEISFRGDVVPTDEEQESIDIVLEGREIVTDDEDDEEEQ